MRVYNLSLVHDSDSADEVTVRDNLNENGSSYKTQ